MASIRNKIDGPIGVIPDGFLESTHSPQPHRQREQKWQNVHCSKRIERSNVLLAKKPRSSSFQATNRLEPLHRSTRIRANKASEQIFDVDHNHHLPYLSHPLGSRLLDPSAAPTVDALILRLERRPNPSHVVDVAPASPTQFPPNQIDDFAFKFASLYRRIDMRPKIAIAICSGSTTVYLLAPLA